MDNSINPEQLTSIIFVVINVMFLYSCVGGDDESDTKTSNGNGHILLRTGGRLNKKDGLTRYGDSHVKDKTS